MCNQTYANRCENLLAAIRRLSALGAVVRQIEIEAEPQPVIWVFACPALHRSLGNIADIGQNRTARVKAAPCLGCEVRWLESHAFIRARQAMRGAPPACPGRKAGGSHA